MLCCAALTSAAGTSWRWLTSGRLRHHSGTPGSPPASKAAISFFTSPDTGVAGLAGRCSCTHPAARTQRAGRTTRALQLPGRRHGNQADGHARLSRLTAQPEASFHNGKATLHHGAHLKPELASAQLAPGTAHPCYASESTVGNRHDVCRIRALYAEWRSCVTPDHSRLISALHRLLFALEFDYQNFLNDHSYK